MKKILLIEDNKEIRETTAEILEMASYKVITAENGKKGVDLAKNENPDLIICDVMMPELDGYGVLHMLSKSPPLAGIPFIFLTAKSEREDMRRGMNSGADDYLIKPFEDMELLNAVETRLKKIEVLKVEFKKNAEGLSDFMQQAKDYKELENLISDNSVSPLPKKHALFSKGGRPNYLYFINKGKVKTFKTDHKENEFITGLFKEGDFLGYIDLLEDTKYREDAVALEDSEICMIKREDFFALIHQNRHIASKFIKMLSDQVVETEERLLKLAYGSVRKRVAEALLLLRKKYHDELSPDFTMGISRDDLASLVGASKENVIRTLTDFKEEGLINVMASKITLLDSDKLSKMKN
jgi:CRP/FNR family transcriptional regulator, polysaccharide utilization system transcription regulator